jgi:hypothetical protein
MIDAVSTSKAWAKRGSEKLKGLNGMFKKTTKEAMQPLLGKGTFDDNVKDVIGKLPQNSQSSWLGCAESPNTYIPCYCKQTDSTSWMNLRVL